jgi:hypothetical protein
MKSCVLCCSIPLMFVNSSFFPCGKLRVNITPTYKTCGVSVPLFIRRFAKMMNKWIMHADAIMWNVNSERKEGCKTHFQPGGKNCAERLFACLSLSFCPHDTTLLPLDGVLCGFILGTFFYYVHSWCQIHVSLTLQHNGHLHRRHCKPSTRGKEGEANGRTAPSQLPPWDNRASE